MPLVPLTAWVQRPSSGALAGFSVTDEMGQSGTVLRRLAGTSASAACHPRASSSPQVFLSFDETWKEKSGVLWGLFWTSRWSHCGQWGPRPGCLAHSSSLNIAPHCRLVCLEVFSVLSVTAEASTNPANRWDPHHTTQVTLDLHSKFGNWVDFSISSSKRHA